MSGPGDLPLDRREDEWRAGVEARLAALEGARAMNATTQEGGSFRLHDDDGDPLLAFGSYTNGDGEEGFQVSGVDEDNSATVLNWESNRRGLVYPHSYHQWVTSNPESVTSGSYVDLFECQVILPNADALQAAGVIITPAATTAMIRMRESNYGDVTDELLIPANVQVTVEVEWLHPWSVGWGDPNPSNQPFLHWEVKRVSGAGTVSVYPPRHLTFRNSLFLPAATPTGGIRIA